MTDILELVVLDSPLAWLLALATLFAVIAMPRLFGLRLVNALAYAQMTLIFNALTIVAGYAAGLVDAGRTLHFFAIELGFLAATCLAYRHLLRHRSRVSAALVAFVSGPGGLWLTLFMALVGVFNFVVVPTDGESRIAYMTASWFSFVKPFLQLASPLAYVGVFIMLRLRTRRRLAFLLLLVTIAANVLTGSKASFLFALLTALLLLRDLSPAGAWHLRPSDRWRLGAIALPLAALALFRLDVSPTDVSDRFMLFGEATILTYFSPTPTDACRDVSTLASMHRGVARALGDASANDIDTLFGFALTKLYLGVNTFTGPNGRLSAYMICNFPEQRLVLGWLVVAVYFGLILWLMRCIARRPLHLALIYPYLLTSFDFASQDFNLIMADITLTVLLLLSTITPSSRRRPVQQVAHG